MNDFLIPPRVPGLNITVGDFLPRMRMPSLTGALLAPIDMTEEAGLAVCIYNPTDVNPFPLPPRGVDLPWRLQQLEAREVACYVISSLSVPRLSSWLGLLGSPMHALSDQDGGFMRAVGIPIKRLEERHFRTHCAFVLQEDRVLSILLETDPIHNFEGLLAALDVAEGRAPETYELPDQPWYVRRYEHQVEDLEEDIDEE